MDLTEAQVECPYCWQVLTVFLDPSQVEMDYVEDCQVCCQPIRIQGRLGESGELEWLEANREND